MKSSLLLKAGLMVVSPLVLPRALLAGSIADYAETVTGSATLVPGTTDTSNHTTSLSPQDQGALVSAGLTPNDSREAALVTMPFPGIYTAIVSGKNPNPTGVGMVEVYRVHP